MAAGAGLIAADDNPKFLFVRSFISSFFLYFIGCLPFSFLFVELEASSNYLATLMHTQKSRLGYAYPGYIKTKDLNHYLRLAYLLIRETTLKMLMRAG